MLHVLARQGCKNIIKVLVDGGEHLNFVDTITEVTPLMYALCYENVDVVETLISHNQLNKADPTKRCNLPGISENISPIECATESKNTRLVNMISLAIADHNKDLEGKAEDSDNSHQLDKTKEVQENHSTQQKVSTNDSADTEVLEDAIELPTSETLHNGNSNANTITTEAKVDLTKKMSTDYSSSNTIGKPSITQNSSHASFGPGALMRKMMGGKSKTNISLGRPGPPPRPGMTGMHRGPLKMPPRGPPPRLTQSMMRPRGNMNGMRPREPPPRPPPGFPGGTRGSPNVNLKNRMLLKGQSSDASSKSRLEQLQRLNQLNSMRKVKSVSNTLPDI